MRRADGRRAFLETPGERGTAFVERPLGRRKRAEVPADAACRAGYDNV
ncbi:hypothetical protein BURPS305_2875 [Burkholderia pseudomallei 305]|nr:hypothetical protein GBP346_A1019 [Burkholderia pseudomallei MSHR346]EBA47610.1 hypothetical protein BURPS305_2875 [Burkholderia pseudomallei 305]EDU09011.1 hypothetical protein BURPS1655_K0318 [Burkholderia pseudomallei 1655]